MAALHPQIVHFVMALCLVGVGLRIVSLVWRQSFVSPAATLLILLGTAASVLAVASGDAAHGPVERVPLSRPAVTEHEDWGERTRNVFIAISVLELVAMALRRSNKRIWLHGTAAALGVVGAWCVYQTGKHGGELVYGYAGGVGLRSGDARDVTRLLLAGLYHQSQIDRQNGRHAEAAALIDEALRRYPDEPDVQLLAAESWLLDRQNPSAALAALERVKVPNSRPARIRYGTLEVDALAAAGERDAAIAQLEKMVTEFPTNAQFKKRLSEMKGP